MIITYTGSCSISSAAGVAAIYGSSSIPSSILPNSNRAGFTSTVFDMVICNSLIVLMCVIFFDGKFPKIEMCWIIETHVNLIIVPNFSSKNAHKLPNVCCSPVVGMLPSADASGNIPTSGEQHCMLHGRTFNNWYMITEIKRNSMYCYIIEAFSDMIGGTVELPRGHVAILHGTWLPV